MLSSDPRVGVRAYRSDVTPGDNTRSANERRSDVGDNGAVQVGHHHDVELTWLRNELHRTRGKIRAALDVARMG